MTRSELLEKLAIARAAAETHQAPEYWGLVHELEDVLKLNEMRYQKEEFIESIEEGSDADLLRKDLMNSLLHDE